MSPPRTRLLIAEWPDVDQHLWRQATRKAKLFDNDGRAGHWSATSKINAEKAYGLWLAFLAGAGQLDPLEPPVARVSEDRLRVYLQTLQGRKPMSIANRFRDVHEALRVLCPDANLELLRRCVRRLQAIARRVDRVRPNVVSTSELYEAGLARMVRVAQADYEKRDVQALQYGLLMAMQACKAMRRRNIVGTRIGTNLLRVGNVYVLQFAPSETKNGKPIRAELPQCLTPFIDEWLATYRPILLRDQISDAMWISGYRQPMAASTITARFAVATEEEFGVRISPHHVRHSLATGVALGRPDKARMLPFLLDHKSDATAHKYYVLADRLVASETYLKMLEQRLRQARRG